MIRFIITATLVMISPFAQGQTLGAALNATNLTWTTSGTIGSQGWGVQSAVTHDGVAAARSGFVSSIPSSASTLQTTADGPGTLSFWWRLSSFAHNLVFSIGNTSMTNRTSSPEWQQQTFYLGSGTHTLRWTYSAFSGSLGGGEPGYVDEVSYTPGTTGPLITSQPPSQSQVPGMNATFSVATGGTPPLSYQWQFNGEDIPGATATSLTITNIQATDLGDYRVIITNIAGSIISSNAALEFGEVTGWGANTFGQSTVPVGATNVVAIEAGYNHGLALKATGTVMAWGWNPFGQTDVPPDLTNVVAISAGFYHGLALKADGTVVFWGTYLSGDTNLPSGLTNVVAVAAGGNHSLVLRADGTVVAWGRNLNGQTNVPAGLTDVVAITAGDDHNLALRRDGTVMAWGSGSFGKTNVPVSLAAVAVEAGYPHSLALKTDLTIAAWGFSGFGVTNVPATASNVVEVSASLEHNLALRSDGTVVAWGSSLGGRTNVPPGLTNVVSVAAGRDNSLALVASGPPVVTSLIVNPARTGEVFTISLPSQSGRVYGLEYKDSLPEAEWTALPLAAGNGGELVLTDSTATTAQRFYRVRRW